MLFRTKTTHRKGETGINEIRKLKNTRKLESNTFLQTQQKTHNSFDRLQCISNPKSVPNANSSTAIKTNWETRRRIGTKQIWASDRTLRQSSSGNGSSIERPEPGKNEFMPPCSIESVSTGTSKYRDRCFEFKTTQGVCGKSENGRTRVESDAGKWAGKLVALARESKRTVFQR